MNRREARAAATGMRLSSPSSAAIAIGDVDAGQCGWVPTLADVVTVTGYGLGLWWASGGPAVAGLVSIALDEVDGRIARGTGTCSARGSALDWAGDVALTPLVLARLGRSVGHEGAALAVAPVVLYAQAHARGKGWRPPVLSARAVLMLATMGLEVMRQWRV